MCCRAGGCSSTGPASRRLLRLYSLGSALFLFLTGVPNSLPLSRARHHGSRGGGRSGGGGGGSGKRVARFLPPPPPPPVPPPRLHGTHSLFSVFRVQPPKSTTPIELNLTCYLLQFLCSGSTSGLSSSTPRSRSSLAASSPRSRGDRDRSSRRNFGSWSGDNNSYFVTCLRQEDGVLRRAERPIRDLLAARAPQGQQPGALRARRRVDRQQDPRGEAAVSEEPQGTQ